MSVKLYIQDVNRIAYNEVFIDNAKAIPVNLGIKDYTEITGSKNNLSFFSYTIEIPYELNAVALGQAVDINVTSAQDLIGQELNGFLESNFYTTRGFIKIQSYEKQNGSYVLKAQYLGGIKNWVALLPTYLRDLELGSSTFSTANVTTIFSDPDPYDGSLSIWYSLKFYQRFLATDRISTHDLRPDIYFAAIINALEATSNTPIQSRYFATEYFRRQMMPYVGDGRVIYNLWEAEVNTDISNPTGDFLYIDKPNWTIINDPLGAITLTTFFGVVPPADEEAIVTVRMTLNITTSKTGVYVGLIDQFLNQKEISFLKNGVNELVLSGSFAGGDRPSVFIEGDHVLLAGSTIRMEIEGVLFLGVDIQHRSTIPADLKTTDWISAITDLGNLIWFYDENNERLIVEPKWPVTLPTGEYVPGFYQGFAEDYTDVVDCATEEGDFLINDQLKRNLLFLFENDSDNKAVISKTQWSHTEILTPKFPDGTTEQKNEVFAAIINKEIPDTFGGSTVPPLIPYFRKEDDEPEAPEYDFLPVILYKMGVLPYEWKFNSTSLSTGVPIAAQVLIPTVAVPVGQPEYANLGYGDHQNIPGIINTFYTRDIETYKYGVRKTISLNLPLKVLSDMEKLFRYLKFTNTTSGSFHVLENFQITINQDKISEIDLIALP